MEPEHGSLHRVQDKVIITALIYHPNMSGQILDRACLLSPELNNMSCSEKCISYMTISHFIEF